MAIAFPEQVFRIFIRDITSAKLKEESDKMSAAPPARARSFTSMIPKAPIAAVTTGFGYFSRSGAGAGGEEGVDAAATTEELSGDGMSVESRASAQSQKASGAGQQPPPKPRRANVAASNGVTPQKTTAPTSPGSQSPMMPGDLDDETMPGQHPADPQVTKTPYEMWLDRVDHCQRQLLDGTMTLFEDASVLEEDPIVKDMLRHYENRHSLDLEEDNLDNLM